MREIIIRIAWARIDPTRIVRLSGCSRVWACPTAGSSGSTLGVVVHQVVADTTNWPVPRAISATSDWNPVWVICPA